MIRNNPRKDWTLTPSGLLKQRGDAGGEGGKREMGRAGPDVSQQALGKEMVGPCHGLSQAALQISALTDGGVDVMA
jgi:hypothetical protein